MNLNILLLVFVLGGIVTFSGIFTSEMAVEQGEEASFSGSLINDLTGLLITPHVNTTNVQTCSGFINCSEAFFHAALDIITSVFFILYDVIILFVILVAIFIFPLSSDAPIYLNIFIWTLEIGGIYVIVGMIRGGSG